jgi:DNA polymerase II large subunit
VDEFLAIGTQIKIERPGKAGAVTPCDQVEGPILLLNNGDLVQANSVQSFLELKPRVREIVDLGEILIPFGEFVENNHVLVPAGYTLEWYKVELRRAAGQLPEGWENPPGFQSAMELSGRYGVPLHPKYNLFWYDVPLAELQVLREHILAKGRVEEGNLVLSGFHEVKRTLEALGALHSIKGGELVVELYAHPLLAGLGLSASARPTAVKELVGIDSMEAVSKAMGVRVRPRAVTRIGARMARPEKAKERKMKPPPHVLFPLGLSGGAQRLVSEAVSGKEVETDVGVRTCPVCSKTTFMCKCECGSHTLPTDSPNKQVIDIGAVLEAAMRNLGESNVAEIKGVQGMISKNKTPEPMEKGILRAKHDIFVFKDGTIRFDMTDVPVTHFRPKEIGLSLERARQLGYLVDMDGRELVSDEQLCELRVQDYIPSRSCGDYLVKVARFIDDMLERYYGLPAFYKVEGRDDLIGHMVIGLAPHTSGGVLCRLIGYTDTNAGYGHPFFHAAKRRNADGDEDSAILLMDGLINFSRSFLPRTRGGLMDAPLVLTTRLDPNEVDKEAHNIDMAREYPLEFYLATLEYKHPKEVQELMDLEGGRLGSVLQYEGFGFTHDTKDIGEGPRDSAYKLFETMEEKLDAQLLLAKKIRAVDEVDVVYRVVTKHLLPDMIGNLKSFSGQKLRCTKCNESYRRIPLSGKCYCGNNLTLTVHQSSVKKYLEITKDISERFAISPYTRQRIELIEKSINSLFENDKVKKCKLSDFM